MRGTDGIVCALLGLFNFAGSSFETLCGFGSILILHILWQLFSMYNFSTKIEIPTSVNSTTNKTVDANIFSITVLGPENVHSVVYISYIRNFFTQSLLAALLLYQDYKYEKYQQKKWSEILEQEDNNRYRAFNMRLMLLMCIPSALGTFVGLLTINYIPEQGLVYLLFSLSIFFLLTLIALWMMRGLEKKKIEDVIRADLFFIENIQTVPEINLTFEQVHEEEAGRKDVAPNTYYLAEDQSNIQDKPFSQYTADRRDRASNGNTNSVSNSHRHSHEEHRMRLKIKQREKVVRMIKSRIQHHRDSNNASNNDVTILNFKNDANTLQSTYNYNNVDETPAESPTSEQPNHSHTGFPTPTVESPASRDKRHYMKQEHQRQLEKYNLDVFLNEGVTTNQDRINMGPFYTICIVNSFVGGVCGSFIGTSAPPLLIFAVWSRFPPLLFKVNHVTSTILPALMRLCFVLFGGVFENNELANDSLVNIIYNSATANKTSETVELFVFGLVAVAGSILGILLSMFLLYRRNTLKEKAESAAGGLTNSFAAMQRVQKYFNQNNKISFYLSIAATLLSVAVTLFVKHALVCTVFIIVSYSIVFYSFFRQNTKHRRRWDDEGYKGFEHPKRKQLRKKHKYPPAPPPSPTTAEERALFLQQCFGDSGAVAPEADINPHKDGVLHENRGINYLNNNANERKPSEVHQTATGLSVSFVSPEKASYNGVAVKNEGDDLPELSSTLPPVSILSNSRQTGEYDEVLRGMHKGTDVVILGSDDRKRNNNKSALGNHMQQEAARLELEEERKHESDEELLPDI